MSTLAIKLAPVAVDVSCTKSSLHVVLADGREVVVPLDWFPRLKEATLEQCKQWRLIGGGIGIHWEVIDEDIAVETLLSGRC